MGRVSDHQVSSRLCGKTLMALLSRVHLRQSTLGITSPVVSETAPLYSVQLKLVGLIADRRLKTTAWRRGHCLGQHTERSIYSTLFATGQQAVNAPDLVRVIRRRQHTERKWSSAFLPSARQPAIFLYPPRTDTTSSTPVNNLLSQHRVKNKSVSSYYVR